MTKEALIQLGERIVAAEETEEELDKLIDIFNANIPYPDGANLFFYPENYNARKDNLALYNPTVLEVVNKCLSYKAIQL